MTEDEIRAYYGLAGLVASIEPSAQHVLSASADCRVDVAPLSGAIAFPADHPAASPLCVMPSDTLVEQALGLANRINDINDAIDEAGVSTIEDDPPERVPWSDADASVVRDALCRYLRWQALEELDSDALLVLRGQARATLTGPPGGKEVATVIERLRAEVPGAARLPVTPLAQAVADVTHFLLRFRLLPSRVQYRPDRSALTRPNSPRLLSGGIGPGISIKVPRIPEQGFYPEAPDVLGKYWSTVRKWDLWTDEDHAFVKLLLPSSTDPLMRLIRRDLIDLLVADCAAAKAQFEVVGQVLGALTGPVFSRANYPGDSLPADAEVIALNHIGHGVPDPLRLDLAKFVVECHLAAWSEPRRDELAVWLMGATRRITADFSGEVLNVAEDRGDLGPRPVPILDNSFRVGSTVVPLDLGLTAATLDRSAEVTAASPHAAFRQIEYRAAASVSPTLTDLETLGDRVFGLRAARAAELQLRVDWRQLARELRDTRASLSQGLIQLRRSYDEGRHWVGEPSEVINVYVHTGQVVRSGDILCDVRPVHEHLVSIGCGGETPLADLLRLGTRMTLSFTSPDMLPLTFDQKQRLLAMDDPAGMGVWLTEVNARLLDGLALEGTVVSRVHAVGNDEPRVRISLLVKTPPARRTLRVNDDGLAGVSTAEAWNRLKALGFSAEDGADHTVRLDAGLLAVGGRYKIMLHFPDSRMLERAMVQARLRALGEGV
jgi:hypothetical protein